MKRGKKLSAMSLSRDQLNAVHVPTPTLRLHSAVGMLSLHADADRVVKAKSTLTACSVAGNLHSLILKMEG